MDRGTKITLKESVLQWIRLFSVASILATFGMPGIATAGGPPKNVIFLIGDGMGFEQVKAAGIYLNGVEGTLSFESLPYQGEITTYSASPSVTDSAAAATALAAGAKVNNGVVSVATPGDGSELETLLEYLQNQGKSTGLVTTAYMTHATPAAFGAHEPSRGNYSQIAADFLNQTRPNVLLGGGANGMSVADAQIAGYTVVTNANELWELDTTLENMVSGQFGTYHLPYEYDGLGDLPHLAEMVEVALDILDDDPDGFFLMVEGGRIDHAGHANDIRRNVHETIEFGNAVAMASNWAAGRTDTLIIVTADHETGGLTVGEGTDVDGYPIVSWSSTSHTGVNVPLYAWGVNAQLISDVMDNTDLPAIAKVSICWPDLNTDGDADGGDLALLISEFGCTTGCTYDVTGDGKVNANDLAEFSLNFGSECTDI